MWPVSPCDVRAGRTKHRIYTNRATHFPRLVGSQSDVALLAAPSARHTMRPRLYLGGRAPRRAMCEGGMGAARRRARRPMFDVASQQKTRARSARTFLARSITHNHGEPPRVARPPPHLTHCTTQVPQHTWRSVERGTAARQALARVPIRRGARRRSRTAPSRIDRARARHAGPAAVALALCTQAVYQLRGVAWTWHRECTICRRRARSTDAHSAVSVAAIEIACLLAHAPLPARAATSAVHVDSLPKRVGAEAVRAPRS